MPPTPTSKDQPLPSAAAQPPKPVHGMGAWLAIVSTYQECSETLSAGIKPLGLKLSQHDVMMNLLLNSKLTQQQLAERSFVTKSHMSAVLTEMVDSGWVSREDSQDDKRSKVIALTPAGLVLAQRAYTVQAQVVQVMMGDLSRTQIKEMQDFSRRAQSALKTYRADTDAHAT